MTDLRQAAQQAIEALEGELWKMLDKPVDEQYRVRYAYLLRVITALREALAQPVQPVQEPTPWRDMVVVSLVREGINKHKARELADHFAAQPLPVQEAAACRFCHSKKGSWTWQCYNCGEIDDVQQPAPLPVQEPVGDEWTPCMKLPVVVHVRQQRHGESHVSTREGITPVKPDDLIMRGVSGEEYPIGQAIFEQTYSLDIAPPLPVQTQRPWVGLTEEDRCKFAAAQYGWEDLCLAVEAKLKEKNHG